MHFVVMGLNYRVVPIDLLRISGTLLVEIRLYRP